MNCEDQVIQPINRDTVHRICSGQVVLSLAIAVKELVENAIDAGATIIDIQLKEYGSEIIEVSDNGSGVLKENFQALTLKHYTSKIKQFDDLENLSTLGFRGEALSSLCALSDLSIVTKHTSAENATKITYDRSGKIISETVSARESGTTVTLENLFSTLPVRRREFTKNLKREFNKMCQLLYAYCLVSKGIKFSCTNTTSKGSKNTVVATEGLNMVKDNITNVFGPKQLPSLIEVEMVRPDETILAEYGIKLTEGDPLPFTFEFFISSVMHGSGRSTNDRQFFYINSRPCDPSKVARLVNEIYKQYNNNQYPFVYLNITSKSSLVDVNVTPDKRQVFLEKEKVLLSTIKASLIEAFKMFPSTYKMQNLDLTQNTTIKDFFKDSDCSPRGLKRSVTESELKKGSTLERFKKRSKTENDKDLLASPNHSSSLKEKRKVDNNSQLDTFIKIASEIIARDKREEKSFNALCEEEDIEETKTVCTNTFIKTTSQIIAKDDCGTNKSEEKSLNTLCEEDIIEEIKTVCSSTTKEAENIVTIPKTINECEDKEEIEKTNEIKITKSPSQLDNRIEEKKEKKDSGEEPTKNESKFEKSVAEDKLLQDAPLKSRESRKTVNLDVSLEDIRKSIEQKVTKDNDIKVRFRSKINPDSNKSAEEELRKHISKEDFANMDVIGQFNLGFIITKLKNDLFIIDQHATDEKYNFEQLQASTVMENQVLVNPKPLQLTAGNESLLIENEDIFNKNGFTFKIDESAPCTQKVSLTSIPLSKSMVFGKQDIEEMLFMLQDSNHTMCRPSRIRAMFATRACRKSVMIGKPLSKSDMRRLVNHMGEIEQPWNCPHGRPTMRHLINLDLIQEET
ncbi:mismatch repair endonuclease PMS2 isoform X2 [Tribolium castaneum]|uniref:Mismatch repair endonuclease PMS2-like Protein n=1 Tax=Tribolium castaneum TaxID=7070 RepID=D6WH35_TRICA|nr:PREDICTED: mismatch repair endonuclease PMS2 isoform X2 [Tribolium castaneum]EFA00116.2 Mismatch repair endonuclease PMS2-like Protein [Tribolium castaneum]|eukprot:XP_008190970.1 PREDICTED: mismatch repair endonuclease PMS2 isoform X2 [Tribolium castaneum]